jgi:Xaa-Pro aminopeptidase
VSRAERRAQVVSHARALGLDGVLVFSWRRSALPWLTGYTPGFVTNWAACWLPAEGNPVIGVRFPFETGRASAASGLRAIPCAAVADLIPLDATEIGLIAGDLAVDETPPELLATLAVRNVTVADLRRWADDLAEVKTPEELEGLRAAAAVGDVALRACGPVAPLAWSDFEVAAAVEGAARRLGAHRVACLVGIGDGDVVTECSGRRVQPGEPVGLELTLYRDGFCMHVNAQLPAEPSRPEDRLGDAVCREARAAIVAALLPGAAVDDVVAVGDAVLERHGHLEHKEYDFGHGLGADTPQHPRLLRGTGRRIVAGAVLTVHVALRTPGGATSFVGGPVVITESGARELLPEATWSSS